MFTFSELSNRLKLDRRRLTTAHLRYAVLRVASMYPEGFNTCDVVIDADINTTLDAITPKFFSLFRSRYAGKR